MDQLFGEQTCSLSLSLSALVFLQCVSEPHCFRTLLQRKDGRGCLFPIRAGWASSPSLPQKSIVHHRDRWPTFTRSPKRSSPLLNFSFPVPLHLCEDCTAGEERYLPQYTTILKVTDHMVHNNICSLFIQHLQLEARLSTFAPWQWLLSEKGVEG